MVLHAAFNVVDIYVVSFLSAAAINAATYGGLITALPAILSNGVGTATVALIARAVGQGDRAAAAGIARQSMFLTLLMSVAFSLPGVVWAKELSLFSGAAGAEVGPSTVFLAVSSGGLVTLFLMVQITAILRGGGDGFSPMVLLVGANLLNAVLNFILVFGCPVPAGETCPAFARPVLDAIGAWVRIPRLEIAGAAWATIIARGAGAVAGVFILVAERRRIAMTLAAFRPSLSESWRLLKMGFPNSAQFFVRALAILLLMKAVSPYGEDVRAAVSIGVRYDLLALFFAMGWGVATASIVGQCLGAGKKLRAMQTIRIAMIFDVSAMAIIGAIYFAFARPLVEFFPVNEAAAARDRLVESAVLYLRVMVLSYPFAAVAVVVSHAMNGAGEMRTPFWIDAAGLLFLQVPACFLAARALASTHPAAVWGIVVAVQALLAALYLLALRRRGWMRASLE